MDRGCITYSIIYIAGILLSPSLSPTYGICALSVFTLIALTVISKNNTRIFLVVSHLAFFCAGAGAYTMAADNENLPQNKMLAYIMEKGEAAQDKAAEHFKKFVPTEERHAILCALTVGKKENIGRELKNAYSNAGALHILALSGLHVGIIFAIMETLLIPIKLLSFGGIVQSAVSILLLVIYCILSGCSPSVLRACTMITIYKIAAGAFRHTKKWDAIALSALLIGTIAPLQVGSIGFQLSYAAVAGIVTLFPTCHNAFVQIVKPGSGFLHTVLLRVWDSISISVCCQITTLPVLMYYFGETSQYFIITNLVAIPLATVILHLFVLTLAFHWLPIAGNILIYCLNFSLEALNCAMIFISN